MKDFKDKSKSIQERFSEYLKGIRTGRVNPSILEGIEAESYGTSTPISQLASITVQDAKTLFIEPWDKNIIKDIEKAIIASGKNISPATDSSGIRITIPQMTEETRKNAVKSMNQELENSRVGTRRAREEIKKDIEYQEKQGSITEDDKRDGIKNLDEQTKQATETLEKLAKEKEKEIMTI